ncbi:hypothetical protein BD410DRAFT_623432 [Rickenella mellea]|uniref:Uncharacterized protein n=1 Tax=Rickenella mellea TaxID=50990 RepID=A0A4Y7PLR5_9AGAM|nr:hypothetical protein BD410DRAFT_623432 [Rickenella mellea]
MTPHHIARLRLQMQDIVHSLGSTCATCACGSRAKDCAVDLMSSFVDGADEELLTPNGNVRPHPALSTPPPLHLPNTNLNLKIYGINVRNVFMCGVSTQSTSSTSLAAPHGLLNHSPFYGHGVELGPLIGAKRGVRMRAVGGADGSGVELVHEDGVNGAGVGNNGICSSCNLRQCRSLRRTGGAGRMR